jgi:RNA polymerase sigma-70 factor, ECF subfamily
MSSCEDARRAAMSGDRKALEVVVAELLPRVRNLVRYLVRGDGDVDDLAQEALVAIIAGLPSHRGEGPLTAWADRVTARSTFASLRRTRRARSQVESGADLSVVPGPDSPPDEYAERRHAVGLLDQIPDDQRHALVLHHVVGMSVPEIATMTGLPFETVRSRLRIGMGKLRGLHGGGE